VIGEYRGKRLFAGRLFAGRLFGPTRTAVISGGGLRRVRVPRALLDSQALREIEEDDVMLLIAAAVVAGRGLMQ
jgi:hypothetical protein